MNNNFSSVNIMRTFLEQYRRQAFGKFQRILKAIRFFFFLPFYNVIYHAEAPGGIFRHDDGIYLYFIVLRNYLVVFDTRGVIVSEECAKFH